MKDFSNLIQQLAEANNELLTVEKSLLDTSFMGIFKKKNYDSYSLSLKKVCNSAIEVHELLTRLDSKEYPVKIFMKSVKDFSYSLNLAALSLSNLNSSLKRKSFNEKYSMSQYQEDLNDFNEAILLSHGSMKKMFGDCKLFGLDITSIDCFEKKESLNDGFVTPGKQQPLSSPTTRQNLSSSYKNQSQSSPSTKQRLTSSSDRQNLSYPRQMTEEESNLQKRYYEQVINNSNDTHAFNTLLKKSIDIESAQINRLSQFSDEEFKLNSVRKAMSILFDFKVRNFKFNDFDNLKLNEKYKCFQSVVKDLDLSKDLSDESIKTSNLDAMTDFFTFNLVALFFQAHMIANPQTKIELINQVLECFRKFTKSEVSYADYC